MKIDTVELSHPNKILFPHEKILKKEVAEYYVRVASHLLPFVKDRPLTLKRYPEGIDAEGFFNKHAPDYFPDFIQRLKVPFEKEDSYMQMVSASKEIDLIYFVCQNMIELHIALAKIDHIKQPDQIVFDLDPSDNDFEKVRALALVLKDILDSFNLFSFVKTTGSRGVHVHIPVEISLSFKETKVVAKGIAEFLHTKCPDISTLEQRKEKRGDKVFIDYLRNDYAMTVIAPYSLRARHKAPIATPVDWDELKNKSLGPQSYTMENIFRRLAHKKDPWFDFDQKKQKLPPDLMK